MTNDLTIKDLSLYSCLMVGKPQESRQNLIYLPPAIFCLTIYHRHGTSEVALCVYVLDINKIANTYFLLRLKRYEVKKKMPENLYLFKYLPLFTSFLITTSDWLFTAKNNISQPPTP